MSKQVSDSALQKMRLIRLEMDEKDCQRLQISHRFMHMSALSPTTRDSHAERHGRLYTADEIRAWMEEDGNDIGCKCSFTLILVDECGNTQTPALIERIVAAREKFLAGRAQFS